AWAGSGYTADDLLRFSLLAGEQGDTARMVSWLTVAEAAAPEAAETWRLVGLVCQREPAVDPICGRFLQRNAQNWLVNAAFDGGTWGWQPRTGGVYAVVACPAGRERVCVRGSGGASTGSATAGEPGSGGAGVRQCVRVAAGARYRVAAWVRVEAGADVAWRPVYVQGVENGRARGIWPGDQRGPAEWALWEQTFVAPEFDDGLACFYPVLLQGEGQFWFYDPVLVMLPGG
ncbi:MAG: hypothetical protein KC425_16615, partial [Anaerolineales bacterium]|nr:hypothetical protein [Anaerolineales bacterium]